MLITKSRAAHLKQSTLIFLFGAFTYGALEILWRGYTHPTMLLLGGICLCVIYYLEKRLRKRMHIAARCILFAIIITVLEFAAGLYINLYLGLDVWDYSHLPFNLLGQVCLPFFLLWTVLSFLASILCRCFRYAFSDD